LKKVFALVRVEAKTVLQSFPFWRNFSTCSIQQKTLGGGNQQFLSIFFSASTRQRMAAHLDTQEGTHKQKEEAKYSLDLHFAGGTICMQTMKACLQTCTLRCKKINIYTRVDVRANAFSSVSFLFELGKKGNVI